MLITVCRLYDSYTDANRVVVMLEAAGLPTSETSVISNNSDTWYRASKAANVVPVRKGGANSKADGKVGESCDRRHRGHRSQPRHHAGDSRCRRRLSAPDGSRL